MEGLFLRGFRCRFDALQKRSRQGSDCAQIKFGSSLDTYIDKRLSLFKGADRLHTVFRLGSAWFRHGLKMFKKPFRND